MALEFDPSLGHITSISSEITTVEQEDYRIDKYQVALSITAPKTIENKGKAIISIKFSNQVIGSVMPDLIKLDNHRITAELYTTDGDDIIASDIKLSSEPDHLNEGFLLNQNSPNPFIGSTDIRFYNNIDGLITTTIYDAAGRQVYVNKTYYNEGWHKMSIAAEDLDGQGLYIYELNNGTAVIRKKMMVID